MSQFEMYNLRDNPFPEGGTLNPSSPDPRENGTIFEPSLVADRAEQLQARIADKLNMVYIMGLVHERGTGKSALLVHQLRRLEQRQRDGEPVWVTYLRCTTREKPEHFCDRAIDQWHRSGALWTVFERLLLKYVQAGQSKTLTESTVKVLFHHHKTPPAELNLMRFFHMRDSAPLARSVGQFVAQSDGANSEIVAAFVDTYLSKPDFLSAQLSSRRFRNADEIDIFGELLRLTSFAGAVYHYIFLDQLEDVIAELTERSVTSFSLAMRRMLEASKNRATFIVTLHPDSETRLKGQGAKHLTTIAPLAPPHRIDLQPLRWQDESPIKLTEAYLSYFRTKDAPDPLFPFTPKAVKLIACVHKGCIREILRRLHFTLNFAAANAAPLIDDEFLKRHDEATVGLILKEQQLSKFERDLL